MFSGFVRLNVVYKDASSYAKIILWEWRICWRFFKIGRAAVIFVINRNVAHRRGFPYLCRDESLTRCSTDDVTESATMADCVLGHASICAMFECETHVAAAECGPHNVTRNEVWHLSLSNFLALEHIFTCQWPIKTSMMLSAISKWSRVRIVKYTITNIIWIWFDDYDFVIYMCIIAIQLDKYVIQFIKPTKRFHNLQIRKYISHRHMELDFVIVKHTIAYIDCHIINCVVRGRCWCRYWQLKTKVNNITNSRWLSVSILVSFVIAIINTGLIIHWQTQLGNIPLAAISGITGAVSLKSMRCNSFQNRASVDFMYGADLQINYRDIHLIT